MYPIYTDHRPSAHKSALRLAITLLSFAPYTSLPHVLTVLLPSQSLNKELAVPCSFTHILLSSSSQSSSQLSRPLPGLAPESPLRSYSKSFSPDLHRPLPVAHGLPLSSSASVGQLPVLRQSLMSSVDRPAVHRPSTGSAPVCQLRSSVSCEIGQSHAVLQSCAVTTAQLRAASRPDPPSLPAPLGANKP